MSADQRFADATLITPDGVSLVSRIWTPQGAGPWPTLLMRQPYGRAIASTVTLPHPLWWTDQGFAIVVQDVRGQGSSDGTFQGFGSMSALPGFAFKSAKLPIRKTKLCPEVCVTAANGTEIC